MDISLLNRILGKMLGLFVPLLLLVSVAPIPLGDVILKDTTDATAYHPVHHVLPHPSQDIPLDQRISRVLKQVLDSQAKETTEYWPPPVYAVSHLKSRHRHS